MFFRLHFVFISKIMYDKNSIHSWILKSITSSYKIFFLILCELDPGCPSLVLRYLLVNSCISTLAFILFYFYQNKLRKNIFFLLVGQTFSLLSHKTLFSSMFVIYLDSFNSNSCALTEVNNPLYKLGCLFYYVSSKNIIFLHMPMLGLFEQRKWGLFDYSEWPHKLSGTSNFQCSDKPHPMFEPTPCYMHSKSCIVSSVKEARQQHIDLTLPWGHTLHMQLCLSTWKDHSYMLPIYESRQSCHQVVPDFSNWG